MIVTTPVIASLAGVSTLLSQGKVRDIYEAGDGRLLMVASDRISTYDAVHPTPVPDKGKVLTGVSEFWFRKTADICPNHLISYTDGVPAEMRGRGMLVERLQMVPVECVVRGYITGTICSRSTSMPRPRISAGTPSV